MKLVSLLLVLPTVLASSLTATAAQTNPVPQIARGPYEPTMDSLKQYRCPDWFRDAKFGIWAHWGPQAVPMAGDWYAKHMYVQGHRQYQHHLENFGHPSTNGYKEIIRLWKADKWKPDELMALYKRAGARYFVSMGSHHDNFFLWNSRLHRWNSVAMGPHRDVVGDWQKAARRQGLRFGVSEHLGASFTWFQDSHGSDKSGPLAGVAYDGADPAFQDLYHFPAAQDDRSWYGNNPRWQQMWFERIRELVDLYKPDLLYTDGGVPFGNEIGLGLIAHYYNNDPKRRGSHPQVVYTCKQKSESRWIEDLERGVMSGINPDPWQTDTSVGDWYYNQNWKFRPTSWTIHMLVDIVSKNGNLLLNVVQRPDGSLDPEVLESLDEMAGWVAVHGEAIYGTRPWLVYGEGPVRARGGHFKEDFAFTAHDIRFTAKGRDLYAIALGSPNDRKLLIKSLAKNPEGGAVRSVELLGHRGRVVFRQTEQGLEVDLPEKQSSPFTTALRIRGTNLKPVPQAQAHAVVRPDSDGRLALLPGTGELNGNLKEEDQGGQPNIGFWDSAGDFISWKFEGVRPGRYTVAVSTATVHAESRFLVEGDGQRLTGTAAETGGWDRFVVREIGELKLGQAGRITMRPESAATWKALNLRSVTLIPVAE